MSNHPLIDDDLGEIVLEGDLEVLEPENIDIAAPLSEGEARALTDTIRYAVDVVWALIARAHAGGAWKALGYETWGDYVREEFDMSRSRSYQLLDQARVVREIEMAVPEGTAVNITEAAARDLKGVLDEVLPEIRERTEGLDPDEATDVLDEIVAEQRDRLRDNANEDEDDEFFGDYPNGNGNYPDGGSSRNRADRPDAFEDPEGDDVDVIAIRRAVNAAHDLYSSLSALAGLPQDLTDVVDIIPPERYAQIDGNLRLATYNLQKFYDLWVEQRGDDFEPELD